jgi:hypothetical protein
MDLNSYVGQKYQESEFYELLLFEVEENFDFFHDKYLNFYFDRTADGKIVITELVFFLDSEEMNQVGRKIIEKREWFQVGANPNRNDLLLVRLDRTGTLSIVKRTGTHSEQWCHGWADEEPLGPPLTPDEIREACRELCGFYEDQQENQNLKSKKTA